MEKELGYSMWDPGTREDFMKAAVKAAEFIRDGGLKEPKGVSSIERKAWKYLERMNAQGFITIDSQAGAINSERCYVMGFMFHEDAETFVENLNLWSDKVAFLIMPVSDDYKWPSLIQVTRDYDINRGGWYGITTLPLRQGEYGTRIDKERVGLPGKFPAVSVGVFDPKWGRPGWSKNGLFGSILEAMNPRARDAPEKD